MEDCRSIPTLTCFGCCAVCWKSYVEMEFESRTVYGASFGMGALPNCIFPLVNLDDGRPEDISFDRAGIMRDDPGAGAFTPYHNRAGAAEHDIAAG
jgi:hypothetical protein